MRKLLILLAAAALCFAEDNVIVKGQKNVNFEWIFFDPGSSDADSTLKHYISNDTVWADSSGTWKALTGTADSCSYPFWMTDRSSWTNPIWLQYISPRISSTRTDSNQITYEIETRDIITHKNSFGKYVIDTTAWMKVNSDIPDSNVVITDSINTVATGATAASRQRIRFHTIGDQGRLCPKVPSEASAGATDTTTYDSLYYRGR